MTNALVISDPYALPPSLPAKPELRSYDEAVTAIFDEIEQEIAANALREGIITTIAALIYFPALLAGFAALFLYTLHLIGQIVTGA